ncbi:hypothetical protein [Halorubrum sp. AJ67]|uniref:hypothetical protein n=1 Tax=Halorubrum sp. AJ67 TaxID=1173487 RepID=UPI0003DDBABE|nr:hypothetical protein [Halorubrum sp. AJ67]CDK38074.1 hypothetical protein BN903_274 [Halorubrum sp. AJ67]
MPATETEYGRGGPYPKDGERFDPINGTPPNGWDLDAHLVGGGADTPRRETALWSHPAGGTIRVVRLPNANEKPYALVVTATGESRRGKREAIFDQARETMGRHHSTGR